MPCLAIRALPIVAIDIKMWWQFVQRVCACLQSFEVEASVAIITQQHIFIIIW
jgi:hypothetical protein